MWKRQLGDLINQIFPELNFVVKTETCFNPMMLVCGFLCNLMKPCLYLNKNRKN